MNLEQLIHKVMTMDLTEIARVFVFGVFAYVLASVIVTIAGIGIYIWLSKRGAR